MTTADLLALVSDRLDISYYEIARRLDVAPNRVYQAKKNQKTLSIEHHYELIKMINGDAAFIMPGIYAERATRDCEKQFFAELSKRLNDKNGDNCILC